MEIGFNYNSGYRTLATAKTPPLCLIYIHARHILHARYVLNKSFHELYLPDIHAISARKVFKHPPTPATHTSVECFFFSFMFSPFILSTQTTHIFKHIRLRSTHCMSMDERRKTDAHNMLSSNKTTTFVLLLHHTQKRIYLYQSHAYMHIQKF